MKIYKKNWGKGENEKLMNDMYIYIFYFIYRNKEHLTYSSFIFIFIYQC